MVVTTMCGLQVQISLVGILIVLFSTVSAQNAIISDVSNDCLHCIAQASYGNDYEKNHNKCINDSSGGLFCGIYYLSQNFWKEAGFTIDENVKSDSEKDFKACTQQRECAKRTIRAYMGRYYRDCNSDGVVNCEDFDRIHFLGPQNCTHQSYEDSDHYSNFSNCLNKITLRPIGKEFFISPRF